MDSGLLNKACGYHIMTLRPMCVCTRMAPQWAWHSCPREFQRASVVEITVPRELNMAYLRNMV